MDFKEAQEKLDSNPELAGRLEEAIKNKVAASEFYGMLVEGGVDAEVAEEAMAMYQKKCGLAISDEDVDEEMLRMVAGGGCGTDCAQADDCDCAFKEEAFWGAERCIMNLYCDEFRGEIMYCMVNTY